MNTIITELEDLVNKYFVQLNGISEPELSLKPHPSKWSKKEIIGHLVDSAQNNIRRFIVSQYETQPVIIYQQNEWVRINDYQHMDSRQLIQLWYLLNRQICNLLANTPLSNLQLTCQTESARTIAWLASDYVKHLKHHMHVVLHLEEVPYP